jgi:CofH/MqnC C-terminal region
MDAVSLRALLTTPNLIDVGVEGDTVRREMHGTRTTFLRVFEVHVDAPPASAPAGMAAGEIRIVGKPSSEEAAIRAASAAAALAAGLPVAGFSLADLVALAGSPAQLTSLCARLRASGLEALADVPLDAELSLDLAEAVMAARSGGLAAQRLTVALPPKGERTADTSSRGGSAMDVDGRLELVSRAVELQDRVGGFLAFAPLARIQSIAGPTTGYADVKQIALARVAVRNIPSIQVDWALYGPKLAQVALTVGADDIDGVAAADPAALGPRRSAIEEIRTNIRAAALEPVERNGRFEPTLAVK